jgi:DNA-binding PadR family transcriptional regulator
MPDPASPFQPLTPAVFHVLLALSHGERHGYAIAKEIRRHTGGRFALQAGTLYGTIQRLLEQSLVEEVPARPGDADSRRRYYRLSKPGRRVLAAEVQRMDTLVRVARARRISVSASTT